MSRIMVTALFSTLVAGAPVSVVAQDRVCETGSLVAARPALQQAARNVAACLQTRRTDRSATCDQAQIDTGWLLQCVDEIEPRMAQKEAAFSSLSIPDRVAFRLERTDFQAAKTDLDLYMSLRIAAAAQNITGAVPSGPRN